MPVKFEKVIERATADELIEPDWEAVLAVIDAIRGGEFGVKPAMATVRKRIQSDNPHGVHHGLMMLEALVKNCGSKVHDEIATREWMETLKQLCNSSAEKNKQKALELIQCWAHAFRENDDYKIIADTVQLMKLEGGHKFPTLREADAMFTTESPPDWVDGDSCMRCHAAFGVLTRKHHCRNCGQIFCDKCSSRNSIIPNYGIEREVRVCEDCFTKLKGLGGAPGKSASKTKEPAKPSGAGAPAGAGGAPPSKNPGGKTDAELQEEEELQLALALSQSEAESKKQPTKTLYSAGGPAASTSALKTPDPAKVHNAPAPAKKEEPMSEADRELARYLNRDLWDQKSKSSTGGNPKGILKRSDSPNPSAPAPEHQTNVANEEKVGKPQPGMSEDTKQFVEKLRTDIRIFENRMKSNQARGRLVINDSSIQQMFLNLTQTHSELLKHLNTLDERRGFYESLNDKVQQIRDAREAINALRQEHAYKKQLELAEKQRQRQFQMGQKLEFMRQQKHEYLERQRLHAIQEMQRQEQEMLMRRQMAVAGGYAGQAGIAQQPQPQPYDMSGMSGALPASGGGAPAYYPPQQGGYAQQPPQYGGGPPAPVNYGYQQPGVPPQQQQQYPQYGGGQPMPFSSPPYSSGGQQQGMPPQGGPSQRHGAGGPSPPSYVVGSQDSHVVDYCKPVNYSTPSSGQYAPQVMDSSDQQRMVSLPSYQAYHQQQQHAAAMYMNGGTAYSTTSMQGYPQQQQPMMALHPQQQGMQVVSQGFEQGGMMPGMPQQNGMVHSNSQGSLSGGGQQYQPTEGGYGQPYQQPMQMPPQPLPSSQGYDASMQLQQQPIMLQQPHQAEQPQLISFD